MAREGRLDPATRRILETLGEPTPAKIWLVRSLERTLGFPGP
jgi:hypothetical protein